MSAPSSVALRPMAISRTSTELRRLRDLATIRRVVRLTAPEFGDVRIGLKEVAEVCRRRAVSRPARDWHAVREHILTIGCEWNLMLDELDDQTDACLDCLARFLA